MEVPQVKNTLSKPAPLQRPPFDAPLIKLKSTISPSLQKELAKLAETSSHENIIPVSRKEITAGTLCKHGGCNQVSWIDIYICFFFVMNSL